MSYTTTGNTGSNSPPESSGIGVPGTTLTSSTNAGAADSNPLHKFQTYNSLFTISGVTRAQLNSGNFSQASLTNIVAASAGNWSNGGNRTNTTFGQYDYWIDDVLIVAQPSFSPETGNAFAHKVTFKIVEPYSMGLFAYTCQQAAAASGYSLNWQQVPFLLTIQFAGYVNDRPQPIDNKLTRYIPFTWQNMNFKVTASGTIYDCEVTVYNEVGFRETNATTTTDIKLSGKTVSELLKTGNNSLEKALNKVMQDQKAKGNLESTDQYEIQFPTKWTERTGSSNVISQAKTFKDYSDNGQVPFGSMKVLYDVQKNIVTKSKLKIIEDKDFQFAQNMKIQEIIEEVVIRSDYISNQMVTGGAPKTDSLGMIDWFRVELFVEDLQDNNQLNRQNRKYIYRVVPYKVHLSTFLPAGKKPPGIENLKSAVARVYNYIYTGKNTDIINLDLEFKNAWLVESPSDAGERTGQNNAGQSGAKITPDANSRPTVAPSSSIRESQTSQAITSNSDSLYKKNGGSGSDNPATAVTRFLQNLLTQDGNLINLDMTILGDPYYLPTSGLGNQIVAEQGFNKLVDESYNNQSGEVDILINFRTPVDLDPVKGTYKFIATVDTFSGLYQVLQVESKFSQNKFTQVLKLQRLRAQLEGSAPTGTVVEQTSGANNEQA